ncbi:MAG: helix-turn-helix transcriptional regulator [Brevibacterium sp.]|nr:helix-turn-helix transcriptional regulator [Brevibacterium sp.]
MKPSKIRARSKANTLEVLSFKQDLVDQRKKHKDRLTQAEVAERMGVSQSTVAELEKYDSNPTLRTLQRYANAVEALISFKVADDCGESSFEEITSVQKSVQWNKPDFTHTVTPLLYRMEKYNASATVTSRR